MKKIILILMLLTACSNVQFSEHTEAGSKYVLDNGLTAVMKANQDTGIVAIDVFIKKTLAADGELHGLSHFTNRMLLAGTEKRTREQITKEIEQVGGSIKVKTYAEYVELIIEIPSDSTSVALDVLQDVLKNPAFDEEEIEKTRTIIIGELESKKDDPGVQSEELFMKTLYKGHPYQHPLDGYVETIQKITREDLVRHHEKWYVPNNIIIAIAGNIKPTAIGKALDNKFGNMKSKKTASDLVYLPQRLNGEKEEQHMTLESNYIQFGYQLLPVVHPDFVKLKLTSGLLGVGAGSRLFYELRDQRALAYTVYSIMPSIRSTGFMKVVMISRSEALDAALTGIQEQVDRLKEEDVSEEELKLVKQKMRGFFFLDHQRTIDQANYLGLYEMQGVGYQYDVEYPERLDEVTTADIKHVSNKYFNNPVIAVVGPFEEAKIE